MHTFHLSCSTGSRSYKILHFPNKHTKFNRNCNIRAIKSTDRSTNCKQVSADYSVGLPSAHYNFIIQCVLFTTTDPSLSFFGRNTVTLFYINNVNLSLHLSVRSYAGCRSRKKLSNFLFVEKLAVDENKFGNFRVCCTHARANK